MSKTETLHYECNTCGNRADASGNDDAPQIPLPDGWVRTGKDAHACSVECYRAVAVAEVEATILRMFAAGS